MNEIVQHAYTKFYFNRDEQLTQPKTVYQTVFQP